VSFPDGYYTAELGQGAATVATTHTVLFHVLAGDSSGNARVDFADFGDLANNFNAVNVPIFGPGDMDGDSDVDFGDFGILANSFNRILTEPSIDFGDAPELGTAFPTTLANNGARHIIGSGLSLGATVDAETDGQPTASASGDGSDEDGVTFAALQSGGNAGVTVIATVPGTAVLNAWIDFNRDGDWNDPDEQVFTDEAVNDGTNELSAVIPPAVTTGTTFARFRLTSVGGQSYAGLATDGEVEDYQITIVAAREASKSGGTFSAGSFYFVVIAPLLMDQWSREYDLDVLSVGASVLSPSVEAARTRVVDQPLDAEAAVEPGSKKNS